MPRVTLPTRRARRPGRVIVTGPRREVVAGTQVVTPTILTLTVAPVTPTVTPGAFTLTPTILTLALGLPQPQVDSGLVPRLRLRRVGPRYDVQIVAIADGLGG